MALGTAREFEGDGDGRHYREQMVERARRYVAGDSEEFYPTDPERISRVGAAVVQAELTPGGWGQVAASAGYIALRRALPQFNGFPPVVSANPYREEVPPSYPPNRPGSDNYLG